jgi:hypothetical protein
MAPRTRTQAEKRDAERATRAEHRVEYVVDQLVENVDGAQNSAHDSLTHEIHEHNITEWRLETRGHTGGFEARYLADGAASELRESVAVGRAARHR